MCIATAHGQTRMCRAAWLTPARFPKGELLCPGLFQQLCSGTCMHVSYQDGVNGAVDACDIVVGLPAGEDVLRDQGGEWGIKGWVRSWWQYITFHHYINRLRTADTYGGTRETNEYRGE